MHRGTREEGEDAKHTDFSARWAGSIVGAVLLPKLKC